jgi:hypothetical protein
MFYSKAPQEFEILDAMQKKKNQRERERERAECGIIHHHYYYYYM